MHFEEDQLLAANSEDVRVAATECTCLGKSSKRSSNGSQMKRIPDFNLLNTPSNIDMYEVMANYIMPRLPDGYRIKADMTHIQKQRNRRSSLMKYATPELKERSTKRDSNVVTELLEPTGSPRNLFPVMSYKRPFQVQIRDPLPSEGALNSMEDESEDEDDVNHHQVKGRRRANKTSTEAGRKDVDVYMLSSFLRDLDELKLDQCPKFQKTLNESLVLNNSECEGSGGGAAGGTGADPELWANALKIIEGEATESRNSFGKDGKCEFCVEMEKEEEQMAGRNMQMGHWSSRDVHDIKFNEDKFTIQFRTGRLGFFGFAANRYSNLPFQVSARWLMDSRR